MLRGHEVSGVLMTYTQVGRAGASGYSPSIQKSSSPATVMPTVLPVPMHSQGTSAQMPPPPDWSKGGKRTSHPHAACKTLHRGKFRSHSNLGIPDNTCWPSKCANQMETSGDSLPRHHWGVPKDDVVPLGLTRAQPIPRNKCESPPSNRQQIRILQICNLERMHISRFHIKGDIRVTLGFPGVTSGKEPTYPCRRPRFNP